jgi:DNA-nicking Smr family endonuclease
MKRRREVSAEERELFETTFADAKYLKRKKVGAKKKAPTKASTSTPVTRIVAPPRPRAQPTGIDGRTAEKLGRGQLAPEAKLDLHGLTEAAAHRALITFLRSAHARGVRLALIVTGKGAPRDLDDAPFDLGLDGRKRGVLRAMTPRWLKEPELARFVADTRSAHARHGGAGALYVYLRKNA